ncbi:cytochrome C [Geomonas agri]|uniref:cytochrome C n=1 Tax=Geomonas agri TaxID=2873702 RepID=UPI001CD5D25D|nr:cytochrome C [Geomonas agri]
MNTNRYYLPVRLGFVVICVFLFMVIASCGSQPATSQTAQYNRQTVVAKGADINALPRTGKVTSAVAPAKAVFGMIWVNTIENREYIFDGADWAPHDQSVDAFYAEKAAKTKSTQKTALIATNSCVDGDPYCTPTGAHGGHATAGYNCKVCHSVAGRLAFAKNGPAYGAGLPAPTFDATLKSCSNVACHAVPPGTFSYYSYDWGLEQVVLTTVNYYGSAGRATPSWYATGAAGCTACHDDPPRNGSSGSNVWHSGYHGGQGPTGALNQCQLCHPDASSPNNGVGDTITNTTLHANGTVNVYAPFTSACFGCH